MLIRTEPAALKGRIDWVLLGSVVGLLLIGTVTMLSASSQLFFYSDIIRKHLIALGLGTLLFLFGLGFNYQIFQDQAKTIYILLILMMLGVLAVGQRHRGLRAWVKLPYFSFQPSELARVLTILVLANFLDRRTNKMHNVSTAAGAFAVVAPVMVLILMEPDFSSTLSFFPMLLGMLFCAGANLGHLLAMSGYGAITMTLPLLWTLLSLHPDWTANSSFASFFVELGGFGLPLLFAVIGIFVTVFLAWKILTLMRVHAPAPYFLVGALIVSGGLCSAVLVNHQLKGYQRNRFVAFLVPEADPRGVAYNVRQAQIAIGSGGLWGKGIFSGTQSKLGFLPERHTDFIYAVIGEEMGFWGAMAVLALYLMLIWRIVNTARLARDRYGYLVCCGIASVYGFFPLINIGMCLGLVPVAGIPLPLLSYGGSNLAITLMAMGIVANVYSRRYAFV